MQQRQHLIAQLHMYFTGSVGETTLQLLSQEEVEEHGLQTVTMSNDGTAGGTTIVQYTHGPDGQIFIPGM
jgi:hypothetical protein